ncbi:ATP-binding protein [Nitrincola sp. MINF-07-Sa-05]|uniref:ATP-binding protein n=1 Tax=Nitrincola salilacus TaxID=3400273 RepID=UPI0039181A10
MKPRLSLRTRIILTDILLAVIVAGAFSLVSYISVKVIEAQIIDTRLDQIATRLIESHQQGHLPKAPPEVRFLVGAGIPPELRQLPSGFHDLVLGNQQVHVLLRNHGSHHYAVVQEVDDIVHTESIILLSLAVGFAVSVLLAAVFGALSARRVIAPVTALAEAVNRNTEPTRLPSLRAQDEIGLLSRAFAKRTDELDHFLQRERMFTGDVSHELRTPLTIILGAAEVLTAQLSEHPAQHATAERIRRVASEASQQLSALLLLARVPETLDAPLTTLNPLIESEIERCQPLLDGKPVQCTFEFTGQISAHIRPELAGILIGNLLRNACRHTDEGRVLIQLSAGRLVIEDTGIGLPPNVRERLFERFVHGSNQPEHEGMGLGLSIVKRVVDHLGWEMHLETPNAGGTRFVLSFPATPTASPS